MKRPIAYAGAFFRIEFAMSSPGVAPGKYFYDNELDDDGRAKVLTLFKYLGDRGRISNKQKFKKINDELWEFKSFQIRMPCKFCSDRIVLISHGFFKKQDSIPPSEIARAKSIFAADDAELEKSLKRQATKQHLKSKWSQ